MNRQRRYQPALEVLEARDTPAGTVTGSFSQGTWTLIGDADANDITINPTATPGEWTITGNAGTAVAGVTNPQNVKNIVIKFKGGDDVVYVNDTGTMRTLAGNLNVYGGSGANYVYIQDMTINKNVMVKNGTNMTGTDSFYLEDSHVKGNVIINNGDGDTDTGIYCSSLDFSYIRKSVMITNGAGQDTTYINDYNIGGNVVARNGLPGAANAAGYVEIYNNNNTTGRSVVKGNMIVTYKGGNVNYDGIWDTEILGNVTFKHKFLDGTGLAELYIDGYSVTQPVVIHGNLTVIHEEQSLIDVGIAFNYEHTGLIVGKNLTIQTGNLADTFNAYRLRVNGSTSISTGGGVDTINIDDSHFLGQKPSVNPYGFKLLTGAGDDIVDIETEVIVDGFSTQFIRAVLINLGGNNDTLTMGANGDDTRKVELFATANLKGGGDNDTFNQFNVVSVLGFPINVDFETVNP